MGRKKMESTQGKYNKSARIRELFDSGISDVRQIQSHLVADGQETSLPTIYTTLGTYKKKLAGKGSAAKASPVPAVAAKESHFGNGLIGQLETIKKLVKDLGVEQVKQMVDLFA